MNTMIIAIAASAGIKAVVFFIYLFLYWRYRERFLGYWTLSWGLIALKSAMDPFIFNSSNFIPTFFFLQLTAIGSLLFIAWGTCQFVGKKMPKMWIYSVLSLAVFSTVCVIFKLPPLWFIIPTALLFGSIYVHTGVMVLRHLDTQGIGKMITAWAFIINGLHQLDFPIFRPTEMAPWGYLLDAFLRLIIGVGFLLAYFEKTRNDLERQEARFRLLAENARDIIYRYRLQPSFACEYISPAAEDITGYKPDEYYANPGLIIDTVHPDDRPSLPKFDQTLRPTEMPVAFRLLRKDQSQIWVEQHIVPIRDKSGDLAAAEGIIRDVTARKELEQELFRLDRLNIVGQMAANIGHEIRNPLTTVRGYLQVMSRKQEFEHYGDHFRLLLDELDRANSLITEYLSLSKNRLTDQQPRNLNTIIESLFPLILADAAISNHVVRLELSPVPDLPLDEKEIRQLLLNFARNGLEAMAPGKTLTIRTTADENSVILAVRNEGPEIPPEIMEKIGIPFFTTKENGTGLGLAICYSIANRHRAKVLIDTGPRGTTFSVVFRRS
ncbi:ATP-binding protein [Anaeroselena agilis]|uniref:histidine kinase n=1 Tax=Anaeroselena agilis TaxID=3063788 RepID=A0ABU3P3W1_9FIRM|nr:PAS domain S-box protein [Selenomonadales bacterium 4137-cl]